MILSDRSIREALAARRIVIDPLDESCLQPSSIDVKVSNLFRVFRNHTAAVIDVKQNLEDLTELVTIPMDGVFMLHPGEILSKTRLAEHVYDDASDHDSNVIEVFIGRLRRKLDPDNEDRPIETLRGRGYRLAVARGAPPPG